MAATAAEAALGEKTRKRMKMERDRARGNLNGGEIMLDNLLVISYRY